ncbi:MAG TPA: hypothetical protein VFA52_03995 [Candidatus Paceibacterota bacterium]|nr:hypothetical protein [Candidatus Paceibacterota bacterium]
MSTPTNQFVFTDSVMGNSPDGVKASSAVLYGVRADNSANGTPVYVKLYNATSGSVVVGTTAPDEIIYVPANSVVTRTYFTGASVGVTFATALTAACVTSGGTAGTTSPALSVSVSITYA